MVKRERKPNNARPKRSNYHSSKPKIKKPKKSNSKSKPKSESGQKPTPKSVVSINPKNNKNKNKNKSKSKSGSNLQPIAIESSSQDLNFFLHQYQSANGVQLSSLELESISDTCVLKLSESLAQDASTLGEHMKASFGASWKEVLCAKQLPEGKSEPGSPVLLTISLSALRSLELLRGLRPLTEECHAAKLFSKHMKVEEQVSVLKNHVNIGCGTPSRIKKLIDMEALGLSRLAVVVLDMQPDVKGYSLFTLPQVRDEFWDLYKSYFHPRLLVGNLRLCLYGDIPATAQSKKMADAADEPMNDEPMNE